MLQVRKWATFSEEILSEGGPAPPRPLRKVAAVALFANPYAGRWTDELDELIEPSAELGHELATRAAALLDHPAESCGKAAIIGVNGEQEHGVACMTSPFGDALRNAIGGTTWVTSITKVGGPGTGADVPLAHKDALTVRSHYDTLTVAVPDGPRPDEILVIIALASGGRIHERVGGLRAEDATAGDGLK